MIQVKSEEEIRAKIMQTLAETLPYKQTLSLRLLITYCIDGGAMQSCVIDEIISRNNNNAPQSGGLREGTQRPMDLSTPKSLSPSSQFADSMPITEKPILNVEASENGGKLPVIWDQVKNILNPLTPNFLEKDNPLFVNNPLLPLFTPTKPLLDNELLQSLLDKLNNGKKCSFNSPQQQPNSVVNIKNISQDLPLLFGQEKARKNIRKDPTTPGVKSEKKMRYNRNFNCNQCRANFNSLADLNRHTVETHSTFKCTICSASFTQRSNLQRHSLKHVGFKPFTCALCKKEYYRKDHLMRHIEVTHPHVDPKSSIITHLTSSECLEYLEKMNLSHGLSSNHDIGNKMNNNLAVNDLENRVGKPLIIQNQQNPNMGVDKNLLTSNDSNNNTNDEKLFFSKSLTEKLKGCNDESFIMKQCDNNETASLVKNHPPMELEKDINGTSTEQLEDDPEDLDDDEDLHNHDSDYDREDGGPINIDFSDESHLMQQTLSRSFKEADTQRQDERIFRMGQSIYESGEIYRADPSDDEAFEGDPGENEAAVATLNMDNTSCSADDDIQRPHSVLNGDFDENNPSELNVK